MATLVRRITVKRALAEVLGVGRRQDGTYGTVAGYLIAEDERHAMAEMDQVIARIPDAGLMRAADYTQAVANLQTARVVWRRAGVVGNPNNIFNPWGDRIRRIPQFPLRDLSVRVGDLAPGSAFVTVATHRRIVRIVSTLWRHALNGADHSQWQPLV